ncbi:hypothetical protein ACQPW1_36515 [Nocardia sp. CA-128927]|uniref:hypothetical protein n=1 Tax=Nocardia sp. CA-128927 TaxID=3239975 RepID=UPI003D983848
MVVTVVDKDAYRDNTNEQVGTSGPFPCLNGRYPSPPLTVEGAKPGHRYVSFTAVTKNGQTFSPIYSPELVL